MWGLTTDEKMDRLNKNFERWIPSYTSPTVPSQPDHPTSSAPKLPCDT